MIGARRTRAALDLQGAIRDCWAMLARIREHMADDGGVSPPLRRCFEAALAGCVAMLPPLLAVVPRGAAPLAAVAGLCAAGLVAVRPPRGLAPLRLPAALLGGVVLWGALSATWSIAPGRSLMVAARLAGLFAAGLTLAAAGRLGQPSQMSQAGLAGTVLAIVLALADLGSAGGLSHYVSIRAFAGPRLDPIAAWLAMLLLPAAALLVSRGRSRLALLLAVTMAGTVLLLDGTAAKLALVLSLPVAALLWLRPGAVARALAAISVVAILSSPLTLPRLAALPGVFASADAFKDSAGHRLLIWWFTGDRIAERPFAGWGLDSSRAIPGGTDEIRRGQSWLPLHPHDAALQVWLELGAPGAALFALLVGCLWLRLATMPWPRLYTAAAGGSLAAALAVAGASWGIWQEWWLGTLGLALLLILAMARAAAPPPPDATPPPQCDWPACDR